MHVIVLKYVQVLCITIFFSNNINCDKLLLHNEQEDQELYRIGACTAACMAGDGPNEGSAELPDGTPAFKSIVRCYRQCSEDGRPLSAWRPLVQRHNPSLGINLICRDSSNLIIEIKPDPSAASGEPLMKLSSPEGNQNQLQAVSPAAGRTKRAIGSDGSHAATGTSERLTDRQKASGASRANQLLPETDPTDSERSAKSDPTSGYDVNSVANVPKNRTGHQRAVHIRPPTPIYLVKVQESEQELGDRIVYVFWIE
uniref:Uncharacterized protein n=1 Tax=Anopheles farauti TaxID=69004 RepID=A0A182QVT3_9DIPT